MTHDPHVMCKPYTANERAAIRAAYDSAAAYGHDYGFVSDIVDALETKTPQAVGALVTQLSRKGVLRVHDPVTKGWAQFTWCVPVADIESFLGI